MARKYHILLIALAFAGLASAGHIASPSLPFNHHPAITGPQGSVPWALLAKATGFSFTGGIHYVPRRYPAAVRKLDNTEILIRGYMMTLQPTTISNFLLVPFPPSCPFCAPSGPSQTIHVHTRYKVAFSMQPVLVRGMLRLHDNDASELLYTMDDAEIVDSSAAAMPLRPIRASVLN